MADVFTLQRGETSLPSLEAVSGDISTVTAITAKLRQIVAPARVVAVTVLERTDDPAGWDMVLDSALSLGLAVGMWQLDARLVIGSSVVITDPVPVSVVRSASGG